MNLYKVIIRSAGRGWTDEKITEGEASAAENGVIIRYSLDGDGCTLTIADGKAVQQRGGSQPVRIEFIEGVETECIIGSGNLCGAYRIFTRSLKFVSGAKGFKLSLEYENGSDGELIRLELTAYVK